MDSETTSQINFKIPIAFLIGIIIGGIGGILYAGNISQKKFSAIEVRVKEEIRQTLEGKGIIETVIDDDPSLVEENNVLSGIVKNIDSSFVSVETMVVNNDAFAADFLRITIVHISDETTFIRKELKDIESYNQEVASWEKIFNDTDPGDISTVPEPPPSFSEKTIEFTDLKVEDIVTVITDGMFTDSSNVTAISIIVEVTVPEEIPHEEAPEEIIEEPTQ